MNTPNPLVPQGSLPQGTPGKFNIRLVVFGIVAAHSLFFCGLLIQGCSKPKEEAKAKAAETVLPPLAPPPADAISPGAPPAIAPLAPPPIGSGITPAPTATPGAPVVAAPMAPPTPVVLPPVTEPAPSMEGAREHVVAKNESFYTIGKKYKVSASAIAKANPSVDSTKLKIGQKLQIPAGASTPTTTVAASVGGAAAAVDSGNVYVVKSGDNLGKIASKNGTTIKALRELNGLKSDRINVGQKLKVPSKGGSGPTPSIPVESTPVLPPTTSTAVPAVVPTAPGR